MLFFKQIKKKKNSNERRCCVNFSTPNGVLMLCCHRSLIQCVIANGLISEGERCERGKGNVQCCDADSFHVNCAISM